MSQCQTSNASFLDCTLHPCRNKRTRATTIIHCGNTAKNKINNQPTFVSAHGVLVPAWVAHCTLASKNKRKIEKQQIATAAAQKSKNKNSIYLHHCCSHLLLSWCSHWCHRCLILAIDAMPLPPSPGVPMPLWLPHGVPMQLLPLQEKKKVREYYGEAKEKEKQQLTWAVAMHPEGVPMHHQHHTTTCCLIAATNTASYYWMPQPPPGVLKLLPTLPPIVAIAAACAKEEGKLEQKRWDRKNKIKQQLTCTKEEQPTCLMITTQYKLSQSTINLYIRLLEERFAEARFLVLARGGTKKKQQSTYEK